MFEKDLPGTNTSGFNTAEIGALPLESCETINGAWGYNATDKKFKSTKDLIHYLVRAAGNNATGSGAADAPGRRRLPCRDRRRLRGRPLENYPVTGGRLGCRPPPRATGPRCARC